MSNELEMVESELKALKIARDDILAQLDPIEKHIREYEQRRAELLCPYKVGDVLVNDRGERAQIVAIRRPGIFDKGYGLSGRYIKKDGTPWKNRTASFWSGTWTKEPVQFQGESPWTAIVHHEGLDIVEEEAFQKFVQMKLDVENKGRVLSAATLAELTKWFAEWKKADYADG